MNKIDYEKLHGITPEESISNINRMKSAHNWCPLTDFQGLIKNMDFNSFYRAADVLHYTNLLQRMIDGCYSDVRKTIFDEQNPFPEKEFYVYVYASEYVDVFTRMKKGLKTMHNMLVVPNAYSFAEEQVITNALYDDVAALKKLVYSQKHIYDKTKFEREFRVNWDLHMNTEK